MRNGQHVPMRICLRLRRVLAFIFISVLVSVAASQFQLGGAAFVAVAVLGALIPFVILMRLWPDNPDAPWRIFSTINPDFDRQSAGRGILVFLGITAFATITAFYSVLWWPLVVSSVAVYLVARRRRARSLETDASDTR